MLSPFQFIVIVWQILVLFYIFLRFPLWSVGMVTSSTSLSNLSSVLCTLTPLTWFQWFLLSTSAVRKAVTMSKIMAYLSVGMHRWTTIFPLLLRWRPSLISQIPAEICIGYSFWLLKTLSRFLYWPHRRGRKTETEKVQSNRLYSVNYISCPSRSQCLVSFIWQIWRGYLRKEEWWKTGMSLAKIWSQLVFIGFSFSPFLHSDNTKYKRSTDMIKIWVSTHSKIET